MDIKKLQRAIHAWRTEGGDIKPLAALSVQSGVSYNTVFKVVNDGHVPSIANLELICAAIGKKAKNFM